MGKPLRHATVLFLLGLLAMASLLGADSAQPWGLGGPAGEDWLTQARSEYHTDWESNESGQGTTPSSGQAAGLSHGAASDQDQTALNGAVESDQAAPSGSEAHALGTQAASGSEAAALAGRAVDADSRGPSSPSIAAGASGGAEPAPASGGGPGSQGGPVLQERPLIVSHVVQRGETLWDIARRYGIDVDTIVAANDLVDINRLQVGQELTILTVRGALHTVQRGESLWDIARAYDVSTEEIASINRLSDPGRIQVGQQLVVPGAQAQAAALRRETLVSNGQLLRNFDWPLSGRISSRFGPRWGRMHQGLDIAVPIGTPVRAAAAGTVTYSGSMGGYGNLVIIDHGNRVETRYAHNSRLVVRVGQRVKRGEIIAYSGNTGNSTGPHLHFEIRYRGTAVDPEKYLRR